MKKLLLLFAVMAMALDAAAVNPDYQETVNGVTSNKIIVVGCKAAVGRVYNPSSGSVYDRGFCWSTSPNPTVNDNKTNEYWGDDAWSGTTPSGSSAISSDAGTIYIMRTLQPSTRYYIRPYIKTSRNGSTYTYGKQYVIWTQPQGDTRVTWNGGDDANDDQNATGTRICQEAQDWFNEWCSFPGYTPWVNYDKNEDGAHGSYGGWITMGAAFTWNTGTIMHEMGHGIGVGQDWYYTSWDSPLHPTYLWTGERANRVFTLFEDTPDQPRNPDGSFPGGGNHTISDGDRVHVCYGLTGNISTIRQLRQAAYYEGMFQDGLPCVSNDNSRGAGPYFSFETDAYLNGNTETDVNTKYYITNEKVATCNRFLIEENGKLTYKKITSRNAMLSNDAFAWYVIYNPANALYYIKNASTGHYFTYEYSTGFALTTGTTVDRSRWQERVHLMPSRNNSTVNGQTLKAYWIHPGNRDRDPDALSASVINQDVAQKAGRNFYDDADYERWFILSADQVNAVGDVADPTPNQGLTQLTALPAAADYSKYFFVLTDHTRDLTMVSQNADRNGNENDPSGNHRRAAWYRSRIELTKDKNALWTLNYNNDWDNIECQVFTNADYPDVMMQTEWGNTAAFRSSDNNLWWDRTRMEYLPDGYWSIHNVPNGQENYLGPWEDGSFEDWKEMAFNKTDANHIGHFNVYSLLRGEHVKYYQDYSSATPGNPLDITYVLENPGAERKNDAIGWQKDGGWFAETDDQLEGKQGGYYFNIPGNVSGKLSQTIHGLPAGYYRFSIVGTGNGYTNSLRVYANGADKYASETSSTLTVVVELTDEQDLEVGVQHYPVYQWSYGKWDNAKLEYIGTNVATYQIDDPVLTFEDNSYVDDVQSFTYDFINQVTTDNSVSFALLNPDAKVAIKKNGTTVKEGSVSLNGTKLTADFSGFTPERNTTYTMTLPAGVVGFAGHLSNVERIITFHTSAIAAGYYYLRNHDTGVYLSRGDWGSRACTDKFGLAVYLSTDLDGNTTFQFFDSRQYLKKNGGDGYCYTDEGNRDYAVKMMIEPQGNGVYIFRNREILGGSDQNCLSVWDGYVICDAIPGTHNQGNQHLWELESIADHHANNDTRNKDAQAAALGITGVSTWTQLEAQMTANYSGEVVYTDITDVIDHWQWGAHTAYEHQLTGLTNGIYRITVFALQRATQWDWMWEIDNTYGVNDVRYLYGNDQKTLIMSNTEDGATYSNTDGMYGRNGLYYPNNTPSAERAFEAGHYKNTVYVHVTNGTLNIGIVDPCGIPANNQWLCYKNLKVERMISGLVGLEADGITDGGYISSPITSVTLKPLNTELTNVTIANNTKVTIYKDDVQLSQVTPTKSGANIIVALPTLVNGSTYKLTLDEKKLTYNNNSKNAAFEFTFKVPYIYDGTYYLYNVQTDDFIERRNNDVYATFLGQSITWTNTSNGGTIKFNDGETNSYIGGRWYSSANESEGNAIAWELTAISNGVYKLKRHEVIDAGYEYLYVGGEQHVASNGKCRDENNGDGNFNGSEYGYWKFMTQADYDAYVITLSETATTAPATSNGAVKVVLNRTITKETWNTICLPFAMTSDQITAVFGNNTIVKELSSATTTPNGESTALGFTEVTTGGIEANTPYILRTDKELPSEFQLRGITLTPSENLTQTVDGIQFIGNYIYPTVLSNTGGTDYYIKSNKFYSSPGGTKLKGFRAYFHVPTSSGVKALSSDFDDIATGVETMNNEQFTMDNAEVYDLQGRRVSTPAHGMYIVNGKKVYIK